MLKIFEKNRPNNLRSASWNWLLCVAVVAPRYNFHGFYSDGLIPSCPLHGMRHVMSELAYRSHHRWSNFHPATGFLSIEKTKDSFLQNLPAWNHCRHLDSTGCLWHFETWYTMIVYHLCGGQVTSTFLVNYVNYIW